MVEPAALHQCPMHDRALATAGPAAAAHASHAAHAGHDAVSQTSPAEHGDQDHGRGHVCTCLGHCSATVAVTVPDAEPLAWLVGVVDVEPRFGPAPVRLSAPVEHLRPFANGPPRLLTA